MAVVIFLAGLNHHAWELTSCQMISTGLGWRPLNVLCVHLIHPLGPVNLSGQGLIRVKMRARLRTSSRAQSLSGFCWGSACSRPAVQNCN